MYCGAAYIVSQVTSALADDKSPVGGLYMERLFTTLNESHAARLQQAAIVMAFFIITKDQVVLRSVLNSLAMAWLVLFPELSPVFPLAWFAHSSDFNSTSLARFWVHAWFLTGVCLAFVGLCRSFLTVAGSFIHKHKQKYQ